MIHSNSMFPKGSRWRSATAVPWIKAYLRDSSSSWSWRPRPGQTWIASVSAEFGSNGSPWWEMVKDAGVGGRAVNHVLNPNSRAWLRRHVVILTHVRAFALGGCACCKVCGSRIWTPFSTISCSMPEATGRVGQAPKKIHNQNHMEQCVSLSVWQSRPPCIQPILHSGINPYSLCKWFKMAQELICASAWLSVGFCYGQ